MKPEHSRIRSVALAGLAAAGLLATAATPVALAQDKPPADAPQISKDEAAKQYAADLATKLTKLDDTAARTAVSTLLGHAKDAEVSDDTKKQIAGLLERIGNPDRPALAAVAIEALSELPVAIAAKPVRDILEKALKAKTPSVDVYGACFRALKKLADPSKATTSLLVGLLQRKENDIVGKAAEAISGYKDAPGKLRRELMEDVIKVGESVFQASRDGRDSSAVAKWGTIQAGVMAALRSLSGQNLADPLAFRQWYNDHKKDTKVWG